MTPATLQYLAEHPDQAPADVMAVLNADYATARNLDRKALAAYLLAAGLSGPFRAAREDPATDPQIKGALLLLQDIVTSGIDYVETTRPEFGAQMAQLLGGLQAAGLLTPEQAAGMVAVAGGWRYDRDLTEEQVKEAQAALADDTLRRTLEDRAQDALQAVRQAITAGERDWTALGAVFAAEGG